MNQGPVVAETGTVRDAYRRAIERLRDVTDSPALDTLVLIAHCLGIDSARALASMPDPIDPEVTSCIETAVERRRACEPVAYIVGRKEFYGRDFVVDGRTLVPRPETELLVEIALAAGDGWCDRSSSDPSRPADARYPRIHDACTGSGAVALSIACERPGWLVSASDLSLDAGAVFAINQRRLSQGGALGAQVPWSHRNTLERLDADQNTDGGPATPPVPDGHHADAVAERFEVIVANPPYVTAAEFTEMASRGWAEPPISLEAGDDGRRVIDALIHSARDHLCPGGIVALEMASSQCEPVMQAMQAMRYHEVGIHADLAGRPRVVSGRFDGA